MGGERRGQVGRGGSGGDVDGAGEAGGGLADVLGGDGGDAVDLVMEARVLEAEVVLVEGHLADDGGGGAAAGGAGGGGERVLVPRVLGAQLLVLRAQLRVLLPLLLRLHLGALVLEPELDLERLQPQLPAQLLPLLVVRVRELLEECFKLLDLVLGVAVVALLAGPLKAEVHLLQLLAAGARPGAALHVVAAGLALHQ
uniref:Uncharacterized protein n=1 Tax=Arundo donax TaxID=35708 RepID=A0A0A9CZ37_ARUDO